MLRLKETKKVYVLESNYSKVWVEFYDDDPETCYITHLYVDPKARRKGEGTQALVEAEEFSKKLGASTAMLLVYKTNVWLRSWYMHNGYEYHSSEDGESDWLVKRL